MCIYKEIAKTDIYIYTICTFIYQDRFACFYMYIHIQLCVCVHAYTYTCIYIYMYLYVYIYTYIDMYITWTSLGRWPARHDEILKRKGKLMTRLPAGGPSRTKAARSNRAPFKEDILVDIDLDTGIDVDMYEDTDIDLSHSSLLGGSWDLVAAHSSACIEVMAASMASYWTYESG